MCHFAKKYTVYALTCTIALLGWPAYSRAEGELPAGKSTSDAAAAPDLSARTSSGAGGYSFTFAYGDTIDYEFPEEDEERNIYKEIALYTIAAAFVAFFIIKVFLEGDTEQEEPPSGGKPPPPPPTVSGRAEKGGP